jgi:Leucine-rich repeat (LRR) protein
MEIKGLKSLENLIKLDLSDNKISHLRGLEHLKNLRILNLKNNKISEVEELVSLPNLIQINLENNPVPEDQIRKLNEKINFNRKNLKRRSFEI